MQVNRFDSFIGRKNELNIFSGLLADAAEGSFKAMLVSGPPGIGKTRLTEEFEVIGRKNNFLIYHGCLREGMPLSERLFWKSLTRNLSEKPAKCRNISRQLADNIRSSSESAPCLVIVDNLHLAEKHLLHKLSDFIYEIHNYPVLFTAAYQDLPAYKNNDLLLFFSDIRAVAETEECCLENLTADEISILSEKITGRIPSEITVQNILRLTNGNPLLVKEISRFTRIENISQLTDNFVFHNNKIAKSVGSVIAGRISHIPESTFDFLRKCALIGEVFSIYQLVKLFADYSTADFAAMLKTAVDFGFLDYFESKKEYRFSHSIIHKAMEAESDAFFKSNTCSFFADTVEKLSEAEKERWAYQLAVWYKYSDRPGSPEKVLFYTQKAADYALETGCYNDAVILYSELADPSVKVIRSSKEADIFTGLGIALARTARLTEAFVYLKKAFSYYCDKNDIRAMLKIVSLPDYNYSGYMDFNLYFREALDKNKNNHLIQAQLLLYYGINCIISTGDYKEAEKSLYQAYELGTALNNSTIISHSLVSLSIVDYTMRRYTAAEQKLTAAEIIAQNNNDCLNMHFILYGRTLFLLESAKYNEAMLLIDNIFNLSIPGLDSMKTGLAFYLKARLQFQTGNIVSYRETMYKGLAVCPDHPRLLFHSALIEYSLGRFKEGDYISRKVHSLKRITPPGPYPAHIYSAALIITKACLTGDLSSIIVILSELESINAFPGAHPFIRLRACLLSAAAAYLTENQALARRCYQALIKFTRLHLIRPYLLQRALGIAAHTAGREVDAAEHFEAALESAKKYNDIYMEAWIHHDYGLCLLSEVNSDIDHEGHENSSFASKLMNAKRHLLYAKETAESAGFNFISLLFSAAAEKKLQGTAAAKISSSLSLREKQVLTLMSEGLTNDMIAKELHISIYTVANHIHHILEKTGSLNRTEAASWARRNLTSMYPASGNSA